MDRSADPKAEYERIRAESQRVRADAIRSRIMSAHAFCAIAETEIDRNRDRALKVLSQVRHSIDEIQQHISDRTQISSAATQELDPTVVGLEAESQSH